MNEEPLHQLNLIAQTLFDKKGFNILALDVRGISTMTDYFLIAEGEVDKHVMTLGKTVIEKLKEEGYHPFHTEGLTEGDWLVLDYMEVVVHLFLPAMREKYRLEELWQEAKIVDLEIVVNHE